MGVLPLQFRPGEGAAALGLTGRERFTIDGVTELEPRKTVRVRVEREGGGESQFEALARVDTPVDVTYYRNGGILPAVLRQLLKTD